MKKLIVFILLFFFISIKAQVSIELAIEWREENNYLSIPIIDKGNKIIVPYLKYTYKNLGNIDVFFLDILGLEKYPILTGFQDLINPMPEVTESIKKVSNYRNLNFKIITKPNVSIESDRISIWSAILEDNADSKMNLYFMDDYYDIYQVLELQDKINKISSSYMLSCFNYPKRKIISVIEARKLVSKKLPNLKTSLNWFNKECVFSDSLMALILTEKCIFLKKGEAKTGFASLIGFYILKGNFTFYIDNSPSPNTLEKTFYDYSNKRYNHENINIPNSYNGYTLYKDTFISNSISIKMD